jgi:hypothetical protein
VQRDLSAQRRKELLDGFLPASARHAGLTVDIRNAILGWPRARLARPLPGDPPLRTLAPCLFSTRDDRLVGESQDPGEVRFYLIRGLAMPVIFLLSIGVSFFSVGAAIWSWVVMIVVDAVVLRRRGPR